MCELRHCGLVATRNQESSRVETMSDTASDTVIIPTEAQADIVAIAPVSRQQAGQCSVLGPDTWRAMVNRDCRHGDARSVARTASDRDFRDRA